MEFFNPKHLKFDFVSQFKWSVPLVWGLIILSFVLMAWPGLNFGIDFRGGVESRIAFSDPAVDSAKIRSVLADKLSDVQIVAFTEDGKNEYSITAAGQSKDIVETALKDTLVSTFGPQSAQTWQILQLDFVGPKAGADLRKSALLSLFYACILVMLYMYWRFDVRFAVGSLATVFVPLIVTTGFLVVIQAEFSTTVVAALLTLAGYAINDTVVVYDRIRESEEKLKGRDKVFILNDSINATLPRTLMTSTTTIIALIVLFFFGGATLRAFAECLMFGILFGTFCTIYASSPLFLWADRYFSRQNGALATKS